MKQQQYSVAEAGDRLAELVHECRAWAADSHHASR